MTQLRWGSQSCAGCCGSAVQQALMDKQGLQAGNHPYPPPQGSPCFPIVAHLRSNRVTSSARAASNQCATRSGCTAICSSCCRAQAAATTSRIRGCAAADCATRNRACCCPETACVCNISGALLLLLLLMPAWLPWAGCCSSCSSRTTSSCLLP